MASIYDRLGALNTVDAKEIVDAMFEISRIDDEIGYLKTDINNFVREFESKNIIEITSFMKNIEIQLTKIQSNLY